MATNYLYINAMKVTTVPGQCVLKLAKLLITQCLHPKKKKKSNVCNHLTKIKEEEVAPSFHGGINKLIFFFKI